MSAQAGPVFQQGGKVRVTGLESRKELNGRYGALLQFDPDAQRWGVELEDFGTEKGMRLSIKPTNLRVRPQVGTPAYKDYCSELRRQAGLEPWPQWLEDQTAAMAAATRSESEFWDALRKGIQEGETISAEEAL